jgi:hypothetical protein
MCGIDRHENNGVWKMSLLVGFKLLLYTAESSCYTITLRAESQISIKCDHWDVTHLFPV